MQTKPVGLIAASCLAVAAGSVRAETANSFAVVDVRVFDGQNVLPKAIVIVRDGRIERVAAGAKAPTGMTVFQGAGKTLLPGLIDAHTHTFGNAQKDALRFGVTTELDMFTPPFAFAGKDAQRQSLANAPQADLYSAGYLATVPRGHGTEYGLPVPTLTQPDQADAWVKARVAEGSDYIKIVYEPDFPGQVSLDLATVAAVIKAADANGKMAIVHISTVKGATEALEAGADGLMHAFADKAAPPEFYKLAAAGGAFVVPTLAVISGASGGVEGQKLAADPRIGPHLSTEQRTSLTTRAKSPFFHYEVSAEEVAALKAAKVDILAGTDAGNPTVAHGAGLHAEMALLVGAGLTPIEALRAATSTPARRFKLADRGRIAAGTRADLLLVEGDPTTDITQTRAIAAIWKNGYAVDRKVVEPPPRPPSPQSAGAPLSGLLGDFETGLAGPAGSIWSPTTDKLAGGASEATTSRQSPGANGSQGALHIEGEVKPSPYAWAGAQLVVGRFGGPGRDISASKEVVFRVRGDRKDGVVMLFNGPQPSRQPIQITPDWREVHVPLPAFAGLNLRSLVAMAITTDATPGRFVIEVDDVRLE